MDNQPSIANNPETNVVRLERQFFGDAEEKADIFEFEKVVKFLQRYKYILGLMLVLGAIAGHFNSAVKTPLYRTSVELVVEPESSNRSEFLNDRMRYYVPKSFYETQQVVIKSLVILEKTARSLSPLMVNKLFAKPEPHWISVYLEELKSRIKSGLSLLGISQGVSAVQAKSDSSVESDAANIYSVKHIAKVLKSKITVGFGSTQELISITVVSSDPLIAAVVANAVADSYIGSLVENRISQTERAGQWLASRIEESSAKLVESENALIEFQFNEQLLDLSTAKSLSTATLGTVNSALLEAEQKYSELSKRYGPKHPKIIDAKKQLVSARSQYGRASKSDLGTNESRFELGKLERVVNSNRELYELFVFRFNEVDLGLDAVSSNTKILERAAVPVSPFSPNIKKSTTMGAVIGLLIGILLLVGRDLFDRTFHNQIQVEEHLHLPVLGILPLLFGGTFRRKSDAIIVEKQYHSNSKSNFSEVVNHIRTGILYSNFDKPPKVILITSAVPKEGKTTCAANLSAAFSMLGKTLLIDADFRKPRIAEIANVSNVMGLTGYVSGQNSLQECLSRDSKDSNLFFMKSGEVPPNPLEMISSNRFKDVLDLMKKRFDYIVIDSAPILPVSDGIVLGQLADAILLVIKAGSTSHHVSDVAMKRLGSANLRPIGVVLSQLDYKSSQYYYKGYGSYYSKEYYG